MQHFYFFLTSEKIWDVDNDVLGGFGGNFQIRF